VTAISRRHSLVYSSMLLSSNIRPQEMTNVADSAPNVDANDVSSPRRDHPRRRLDTGHHSNDSMSQLKPVTSQWHGKQLFFLYSILARSGSSNRPCSSPCTLSHSFRLPRLCGIFLRKIHFFRVWEFVKA